MHRGLSILLFLSASNALQQQHLRLQGLRRAAERRSLQRSDSQPVVTAAPHRLFRRRSATVPGLNLPKGAAPVEGHDLHTSAAQTCFLANIQQATQTQKKKPLLGFWRRIARRLAPLFLSFLLLHRSPVPTNLLGVPLGSMPAHAATPVRTVEPKKAVGTLSLAREGRLMDLSKVIDASQAARIESTIAQVEADTGTEFQVLIVDKIQPSTISSKTFATETFNRWRIGPKEKNNGVLLLVSLNDRRVEIEIGKGLNHYMDSSWCTAALETHAVPSFKLKEYGVGIANVVTVIAQRLRDVDSGVAESKMHVGEQRNHPFATSLHVLSAVIGSYVLRNFSDGRSGYMYTSGGGGSGGGGGDSGGLLLLLLLPLLSSDDPWHLRT